MVTYNEDLPSAPSSARVGEGISRVSLGLDLGIALFRSAPAQMREISRLSRMTDGELEALGMTRSEITRRVYRETLSL